MSDHDHRRPMSELELAARVAWVEWGSEHASFARCSSCGEIRHVRGRRRSWMLCLECFDLVGPGVGWQSRVKPGESVGA
jgi:hypothetical protein